MKLKNLIIISFLLFTSFGCSNKNENSIKEKNLNNKEGIVSLTSLTSDIIYTLKPNSLIGIPGSSVLKKNNDFKIYQ